MEIWFFAIVAAALVGTSPMPVVSGPMLLGQTIGAFVAFARARQAVRPYAVAPATIREAEIGARQGLPGGLVGQLGPFLILFAAAAYVALYWERRTGTVSHALEPRRQSGQLDRQVGRQCFSRRLDWFVACAMMLFTSYAVLHWTRLPRVTGAAGEESRRVRRVNLIATLASEYMIALLFAWTMVVSMFSDPGSQPRLPLAFRVAPFALVITGTLVIRVMRRAAMSDGPPIGDTTPDSCWIFGRLYVNRTDPVLFVARRTGLGYTLNLGNPWSWLVVMVFVLALSIPLMLVP